MVPAYSIPTIMIVIVFGLVQLQQHQNVNAFICAAENVNTLRSSSSLTLPSSFRIQKKHGRSSSCQQQQQQNQQEGIVLSQASQRQTRRNVLSISELYDIIRIFAPKIILELFGSVGACWGFSEIIGLRTAVTVWFWKPFSLAIGGLYTIRFCFQLQNHYKLLVSKRPIIHHSSVLSNNNITITRTDTDVDDLGLEISIHPSASNLTDTKQ